MKNSYISALKLIKDKYRWKRLYFKHWSKIYLFILLPFFVLSTVLYFYYSNFAYQEIFDKHYIDFIQRKLLLENTFENVENRYISLTEKNAIKMFLNYTEISKDNLNVINNIRDVQSFLSSVIIENNFFDSIYLYGINSQYILSSSTSQNFETFSKTMWYQKFMQDDEFVFFVSSKNEMGENILSVCYRVEEDHKVKGLLVVNINIYNLLSRLSNSEIMIDQMLLLTSKDNLISSMIGTEEYDLQKIKNIREHGNQKSWEALSFYSKLKTTSDINVYTRYSLDSDKIKLNRITFVFIGGIIFVIFIPVILSLYLSMDLYRSTEDIIFIINSIEDKPYMMNNNTNELEYIVNNIKYILNKKSSVEDSLIQKIVELRQLKNTTLQLQFNDHFLFNTLNMISISIMNIAGMKNPVSKSIRLLSELLDAALDTTKNLITLKEEVDYAKKYLSIEFLLNDKFDVRWNIAEETKEIAVPKFLLQPIIENSFQHGIKRLENKKGILTISSKFENENLIISVRDNGKGITIDTLKNIQEKLNKDGEWSGRHIGLYNTNQKIKLIYGENYGCNIISNDDGTIVTMVLPNKNSRNE